MWLKLGVEIGVRLVFMKAEGSDCCNCSCSRITENAHGGEVNASRKHGQCSRGYINHIRKLSSKLNVPSPPWPTYEFKRIGPPKPM